MNSTPRKSVVIVDDEESYVSLLSQLLSQNLDCPIVTFTDPVEALAALPDLDVGVVVSDFSMPKLNGLEFVQRAEPLLPGTPFIVVTGHLAGLPLDGFSRIHAVKAVLSKPVGWRKIAEEILRVWPDEANVPALKPDFATSI